MARDHRRATSCGLRESCAGGRRRKEPTTETRRRGEEKGSNTQACQARYLTEIQIGTPGTGGEEIDHAGHASHTELSGCVCQREQFVSARRFTCDGVCGA